MMDDPANVTAEFQPLLIPTQLKAPCPPHYPFKSHTIRSDWAEMDTVIEHLRQLHRVKKISLVGWSGGGSRCGGYASMHPDNVERMVLFAPAILDPGLKKIPEQPGPGAPTTLQTRAVFEKERWDPDVGREGQVAPGVRDALWKQIMQWDRIGASWGPAGAGGVIRAPDRTRGWNPAMARKVKSPVLLIVGDHDKPHERGRQTYDLLRVRDKAFVDVAFGSHFMAFEKQRHVLHSASLQWLAEGRINGERRGTFKVNWDGRWSADQAMATA
jgi:pimeloyl-ACP methyl ester carboxylesterase